MNSGSKGNAVSGPTGTLSADLLEAQKCDDSCSTWEYGYARFDNGEPVDRLLAQLYLSLGEGTRSRFANPFKAEGPNSFLS